MAKMSYSEQLRHPNWQRKRLEAMEAAEFGCEKCDDTETTLNVHHKRYIKGRMAWEYGLEDLVVLCEPCHEADHADRDLLNLMISEVGTVALEQIVGLMAGYFGATGQIELPLAEMGRQDRELFYEQGLAAAAIGYTSPEGPRNAVREHVAKRPHNQFLNLHVKQWDEEP